MNIRNRITRSTHAHIASAAPATGANVNADLNTSPPPPPPPPSLLRADSAGGTMLPHRSQSAPSRSRRLVRLPALLFGAFALLAAGLAHSQAVLQVTPTLSDLNEGQTQTYTGTLSQVEVDQTITLRFRKQSGWATNADYAIVDVDGNPLSEITLTYSNTSVPANRSQTFQFAVEIVDDDICEITKDVTTEIRATAVAKGSGGVTPNASFAINILASDDESGPCAQPVPPRAGFRTIWESTLTVDIRSTDTNFRGCSHANNIDACSTGLDDDDFTLGGTDYTIRSLYYATIPGGRVVNLWVTGSGALPADSTLRTTSDWVFRVGDNRRGVNSYTKASGTFDSSNPRVFWGANTLRWPDNSPIGIRLEVPASTDTTLSTLSGNGSTDGSNFSVPLALTPSFAAAQLAYSASVASNVTQVKLTPATTHSDASMQVGLPGNLAAVAANADSAAITLTYGANTILTVVTAEDNFSKQTYTLTVTRVEPSSSLDELTVNGSTDGSNFSPVALTPSFSMQQLTYTAAVDYDVTQVKLTPPATDSASTVEVGTPGNLATVATGEDSAAIPLNYGANSILAVITASDNSSTQTYTVTVTRADPPSSLDELTVNGSRTDGSNVSPVALTPSFSTQQLTYMASVDRDVTQVKLTPTATDSAATVQVGTTPDNLATVATGAESEAILLNTDDANTTILVVVTASNNSSTQTYTLTVTVTHAGVAEQLHRTALPEVARAVAARVNGAISARVEQAWRAAPTASANLAGQSSLAGVLQTHAPSLINDNRPLRDLLNGSDFVLPLNGGDSGGGAVRSASVWGSGEYRSLSGEDGDLEFDGSLYGAQLGVDAKVRDNLLVGMALSWSDGEFEYESGSGGASSTGDYEVDVISLHPYLSGHIEQFDWWATFGYGSGEVVVTPDSDQATSNDLSMAMLGVGGSGVLWSRNDTRVHLKGEFTRTQMDVDRSAEVDSLSVKTDLARIALAASRTRSLAGGGQMSPSLSLGVRQDGGDGNTGTGAEIGGSVRYDNAESGVSASLSAHGLFGRSDYEEWGVQALVRLSPGADGQGLSFEMRPGYGNGGAGVGDGGRIWSNGLRGDAIPTAHDPSGRLEMRLGYGLSAPGGRNGLLTPWSGLTLHDNGKLYRLGLDWSSGGPFTLRLHGERREHGRADADHAILLKGETRF